MKEPGSAADSARVSEWMRARAVGDAQMSRAAARHPAEPADPGEDASPDVTMVLTREHNQVQALVQQLQALPGRQAGGTPADAAGRKSVIGMIAAQLSRHEAAEEELLWPAVRAALPDGDAWAGQALAQESEGGQTLTALGKAEPGSDEFDSLAGQFVTVLRQHVAHEAQVFLLLREALSQGEREKLGEQILEARKTKPAPPRKRAPRQQRKH
jgi:hemerythrin-like domain-containing protein